jgi:mono/diheme cytochrome c family protein
MNTKRKLEDEINFKDAFTNPMRMFGWVFISFIGLILVLGIYYVNKLGDISSNVQPTGLLTDSANVKTELITRKGGISPAVDLAIVKDPKPDFIANGKKLFDANCKACHGDNGMGDGQGGVALNPKPRNFHAADGWTNGRNIDLMYKTLQEGIAKNGMAAYEYLAPADRFAIISYIRTLAAFPPIKDEELKSLDDEYQLSKGIVVPSQISVASAKTNLINDNSFVSKKVENAKTLLASTKDSFGALLLNKVALNKDKLFTAFINQAENQSAENFILTVIANPINSGFKPTVVQLSKEDFKLLYDYLKTVTM